MRITYIILLVLVFIFLGSFLSGINFIDSILLSLVTIFIFFLPGFLWLRVSFEKELDNFEKTGWSFLISIAFLTIHLFVFNILLNLRFNWGLVATCLVLIILEVSLMNLIRLKSANKTRNKKILFLINNLGIGGAEKTFVNQINHLNAIDFDVFLGLLYKTKEDFNLNLLNIKKENIYDLDFRGILDFKKYFVLKKIIQENSISLVYSTLNDANFIARIIKVFFPDLRVVIRESNIIVNKSISLIFCDFIFNCLAERIIFVSNEVKKSFSRWMPFYRKKFIVIENGIKIPLKVKMHYKISNNIFKILNIGSLTPKKGQILLLKAFYRLSIKHANIRLTIVGSGVEKNNLEKFIREKKMTGRVEIINRVDPSEIEGYYLDSDLFVLSSRWEGCPNVLLEAMSYGLPVISTDVSGAVNIIENEVSGFIVRRGNTDEMSEKIELLINNLNIREKIGQNAKNVIFTKYEFKQSMDKLIKIFI